MCRRNLYRVVMAAAVAALLSAPVVEAQRAVPSPESVLGFEPGTDRRLPTWDQVVRYFTALDAASPRVQLRTLGQTTGGRPFIAAFIADSAVLAELPRYQAIQQRLADPRGRGAGEREQLIADGRVVVLMTSSIHSTEVGAILSPLVIAHRLASSETEDARMIRANTITILVPSLNPDGVDIVGRWYSSNVGTLYETSPPPVLYHHYTGHDNNRDWYAFTQVETRLTIDSLHNGWKPQIVNDIHQQQSNAARIFIPPYMDPIEPNVDPLLVAGVNQLGMSMIWRMTAEGKTGIATNASYDAWTPARAYQHYHGGVRILTETASAALASPLHIPFDSLRSSRGYDARERSWNFVSLWPGGRWGIREIIDYQASSSWALLSEVARDRATWLETFARIQERAVAGRHTQGRENWPVAFAISERQPSDAALRTVLRILQRGQVEVRRATAPFTAAGTTHPAGTYVIQTGQPYGAFAKTLLERQEYPNLREYPGGPPKRPYDVTAHTLPLLMGMEVATITDSVRMSLSEPIAMVAEPTLVAEGLTNTRTRRIALFRNFSPSMDEGWTRYILDQYRIPYTSVSPADVRRGDLGRSFDVIILPDQNPRAIESGPGSAMPDSVRGGLGAEGARALRAFAEGGGTIVAFNNASSYAIRILELPVRDVLAGVAQTEFYAPGSILSLELDRTHRLARGITAQPIAWFEGSPAFEVTDPARARVVARYPQGDPLLSGWLLGGELLAGKGALVEATLGRGRVVLFGFRPQYRAQSMATYPLIWSALH